MSRKLPFDALKETVDPFIKIAISKGCKQPEDFRKFFDELLHFPLYLCDKLILEKFEESDENISKAIKKGQEDKDLSNEINDIFKCKIHSDKRNEPLLHDVGLIRGVEHIKKTNKCWLLTTDSVLIQYAIDHCLRDDIPFVFGIDILINILAIDDGGVEIDASNYVPLFANIVRFSLIPDKDIFKPEDLSIMLDVHQQISELPAEKIIEMAKNVNKSRLSGLSDEKIALQLTRSFQSEKLKAFDDLEDTKKELMLERQEKARVIERQDIAEKALREEITKKLHDKYDRNIFISRFAFFIIIPLFCSIISLAVIYVNILNIKPNMLSYIIGILSNIIIWLLTGKYFINPKLISKYSERVSGIDNTVNDIIRNLYSTKSDWKKNHN